MDDWYNVTQDVIKRNGGGRFMIDYYKNSPSSALQNVYPEHNWDLEKFKYKPRNFWDSLDNQKKFFDRLHAQLGYTCMDDWYKVTQDDIYLYGGAGLLNHWYKGTPWRALLNIYPQHHWMMWRFKLIPKGYWEKITRTETEELKTMMDWLGEQLSIKCFDDWCRISLSQIKKWIYIGSATELVWMLQKAYPQHQWDIKPFDRIGFHVKASQREVNVAVKALFPNHSMISFILA